MEEPVRACPKAPRSLRLARIDAKSREASTGMLVRKKGSGRVISGVFPMDYTPRVQSPGVMRRSPILGEERAYVGLTASERPPGGGRSGAREPIGAAPAGSHAMFTSSGAGGR